MDPQTLSELPPEIRADIERQLALWRKTRRPPAKKPRRSMDAFLGARPAPPPPAVVDEDAIAQIVAMGFSRKSAVAALERYGDVQRAIDGLLASS